MFREMVRQETESLRDEYSVFELHSHTYCSDGLRSPEAVVREAYLRGLSGIAITDHDNLDGYERAAKEAEKYPGFIVVPGMEVSTTQGHVLALGVYEPIEPGRSWAETVDDIHDKGGVAVLAHPYVYGSVADGLLESYDGEGSIPFDAIEAYNARLTLPVNGNKRGEELVDALGYPSTGGSDAHEPWGLGLGMTLLPKEVGSIDDVLDAIREGRCEPYRTREKESLFNKSVFMAGRYGGIIPHFLVRQWHKLEGLGDDRQE
ncbi:MAG: CehA/McbA family metallohydrolase [Candidatus Undinarchaeales archaeon]|jgi:hypothetical protein|nr:CehA/McbA family metallohydrolase [Candidatus Undinarchaeales archaeon]MDP7493068.1 CehA/McbA family metallohydrolase [Candidatus Undinarchaeales archaeon]